MKDDPGDISPFTEKDVFDIGMENKFQVVRKIKPLTLLESITWARLLKKPKIGVLFRGTPSRY